MSKSNATPAPAPVDPLARYSINEGSRLLRISRAQIYKDIAAQRLRTIREGGRQFIPGSEIVRRCTLPSASAAA